MCAARLALRLHATRRTGLLALSWRMAFVALIFLALSNSIVPTSASFSANTRNVSNSFANDVLDAPSSLSASVADGSVVLNWTATTDSYATGHRVFRSTASGGPYTQIAQVTPRTTTTYTDSPPNGTYYYVVRAYYQGWQSAPSNQVSATVSCILFICL